VYTIVHANGSSDFFVRKGGWPVQILLNGREADVPAGITVEQLLSSKKITPAAVVVAVNSGVVGREAWRDFIIKEKDQVEVIKIVGGG